MMCESVKRVKREKTRQLWLPRWEVGYNDLKLEIVTLFLRYVHIHSLILLCTPDIMFSFLHLVT